MAIYFGTDIATKLALANTYYGEASHILTYDWNGYSDNEKKAGLVQAEREIDSHLGLSLEETFDATSFPMVEGSSFRPDYAVFEQALYLLENTARARTAAGGAEMIESEEYQQQERGFGVGMSPEAAAYLRVNRIQCERG